ncbi:hypothetical protein GALMADRAFT_789148 [Galerina marginata CBS 339.88]|uniref:Uncharacterized protein n=1 Tax=Galerina marginata (strain CBS 339.88) TaxID=685588 RepID=A0A067SKR8_GALM3|nr:hypothetical protein GALMADRAFT_789148 [Galerina marginata CBS 339.88]
MLNGPIELDDRDIIHIFNFNPFRVKFMAKHALSLIEQDQHAVLRVVGGDGVQTTTTENIFPGGGVFTKDIVGMLPYVEVQKEGWGSYGYDGILIDEERLIRRRRIPIE